MHAFLADLVAGVHLAIVLFMIFGLALVIVGGLLRWRWVHNGWFRLVHLGIMGYIVFNAARGELCFLTHWESDLRAAAGQNEEEISFVGRLLRGILYVDVPQDTLHKYYFAFGLLVLLSTLFVRPRFRRSPAKAS